MAKKSFRDSLSKTHLLDTPSGIKGVFSSTEENEKSSSKKTVTPIEEEFDEMELETRQTFLIQKTDWERLKDFVYYKKVTIDPFYKQKDALHDALELLFNNAGNFAERPQSVKRMERSKAANIKKKLKSNKE